MLPALIGLQLGFCTAPNSISEEHPFFKKDWGIGNFLSPIPGYDLKMSTENWLKTKKPDCGEKPETKNWCNVTCLKKDTHQKGNIQF